MGLSADESVQKESTPSMLPEMIVLESATIAVETEEDSTRQTN